MTTTHQPAAEGNDQTNKTSKGIYKSAFQSDRETMAELVYDKALGKTAFVYLSEGKVCSKQSLEDKVHSQVILPYEPTNTILTSNLIRLPSKASPYQDEEHLLIEIREFIHKFCDLTPTFEAIAAHYVLLTWVYDAFNEVPYLRVIADFGQGKSRFLNTVGTLCYKPIFANGGTSVSAVFRTIEAFHGTLVLDEADLKFSGEQAEMVKILNSGNAKGIPVLRSDTSANDGGQYNPRAYAVFGPKIVATRGYYDDKALESRFIVEELGFRKLRPDIPVSLPESFDDEALELRNKLLMYRLKNWNKVKPNLTLKNAHVEPRVNQVVLPLVSLMNDPELIEATFMHVQSHHDSSASARGLSTEGYLLEIISDFYNSGTLSEPYMKDISDAYNERMGEINKYLTIDPRRVGQMLKKTFRIRTERNKNGYYIPSSERMKLEEAFARYGITDINKEI